MLKRYTNTILAKFCVASYRGFIGVLDLLPCCFYSNNLYTGTYMADKKCSSLIHLQQIEEFTDVNEGEKEVMKLWNLHVMKHG